MTPDKFYYLQRLDMDGTIYKAERISPSGHLYMLHPAKDSRPGIRSYVSPEYVSLRLGRGDWLMVPEPPSGPPSQGGQ